MRTVTKTCEQCGKLHNLLDLKDTKEWPDLKLVIWNCPCKATLAIKQSVLIDIILDNAYESKAAA